MESVNLNANFDWILNVLNEKIIILLLFPNLHYNTLSSLPIAIRK